MLATSWLVSRRQWIGASPARPPGHPHRDAGRVSLDRTLARAFERHLTVPHGQGGEARGPARLDRAGDLPARRLGGDLEAVMAGDRQVVERGHQQAALGQRAILGRAHQEMTARPARQQRVQIALAIGHDGHARRPAQRRLRASARTPCPEWSACPAAFPLAGSRPGRRPRPGRRRCRRRAPAPDAGTGRDPCRCRPRRDREPCRRDAGSSVPWCPGPPEHDRRAPPPAPGNPRGSPRPSPGHDPATARTGAPRLPSRPAGADRPSRA